MQNKLYEKIEALRGRLSGWRRYMHQHPELSYQEHKTTAYLHEVLKYYPVDKFHFPLRTGMVAEIQGERPGPVVVVKSDIDALPIQEENEVPYKSQNAGIMHACGHDAHTAILVGLGAVLSEMKAEWAGTLLLVFEPGEEVLPGGAELLLDTGFLQAYKPRAVLALHAMPDYYAGEVGFRAGNYMASGDELYIDFIGKGGHAGLPNYLADPVMMAAQAIVSMQTIISRNAPPEVPSVLSFGKIAGGTAMNIIPDKVSLAGTFRTFDEEWRKQGRARIQKMAASVAESMDGRADVQIKPGYPTLSNDPKIVDLLYRIAPEIPGISKVHDMGLRMTTDDFAYLSQTFPAAYFRLGVRHPGWDQVRGLHTATFDVDERSLPVGLQLMARSVVELLKPENE